MVGEKISARISAIPNNTLETLTDFKNSSLVDAAIGAGKRFGRANRNLLGIR